MSKKSKEPLPDLREVMLAELKGGKAGIAKWNARDLTVRVQIGKLNKHDFAKLKLNEAQLDSLNLQGTCFDEASLREARLSGSLLQKASFSRANLTEAWIHNATISDASFAGATLVKCMLADCNLRRANFRDADLTNANLSGADVTGADFSTAILTDVIFRRAKFDEKTQFPPGFAPPDDMVWKGSGPRPTSAR